MEIADTDFQSGNKRARILRQLDKLDVFEDSV